MVIDVPKPLFFCRLNKNGLDFGLTSLKSIEAYNISHLKAIQASKGRSEEEYLQRPTLRRADIVPRYNMRLIGATVRDEAPHNSSQ